ADGAAGQLEGGGAEVEVEPVGARQRGGEAAVPQPGPLRDVRQREVDDDVEAAGERVVDVRPEVGREHGEAVEALQPLQQVGALDVRVPVVGVLDIRAVAEDGVGLVKEAGGVYTLTVSEDR